MTNEAITLSTKVILKKWTKEQTDAAAALHNVHPDSLTSNHFEQAGLTPEILQVDHSTGIVTHQGKTYTIDQWNELNTPKQFIEGKNGN